MDANPGSLFDATLHPSIFDGAARYHSGGIVGPGLSHGERPIIAKDTEAVLPTVRMSDGNFGIRALMPDGGEGWQGDIHLSPVVQVQTPQGVTPAQSQQHGTEITRQLMPAMRQMVQSELVAQLRPGGILRGGTGQNPGS